MFFYTLHIQLCDSSFSLKVIQVYLEREFCNTEHPFIYYVLSLFSFTHDIEAVSCDEMYVDLTELLHSCQVTPLQFATYLRQKVQVSVPKSRVKFSEELLINGVT